MPHVARAALPEIANEPDSPTLHTGEAHLPKLTNSGNVFRGSAAVPDGAMGHNVENDRRIIGGRSPPRGRPCRPLLGSVLPRGHVNSPRRRTKQRVRPCSRRRATPRITKREPIAPRVFAATSADLPQSLSRLIAKLCTGGFVSASLRPSRSASAVRCTRRLRGWPRVQT